MPQPRRTTESHTIGPPWRGHSHQRLVPITSPPTGTVLCQTFSHTVTGVCLIESTTSHHLPFLFPVNKAGDLRPEAQEVPVWGPRGRKQITKCGVCSQVCCSDEPHLPWQPPDVCRMVIKCWQMDKGMLEALTQGTSCGVHPQAPGSPRRGRHVKSHTPGFASRLCRFLT